MTEPIRKTSHQWHFEHEPTVTIIDHDGWDRKNFYFSFYEELITEEEFNNRLIKSTVMINWKDK